MAKRKRDEQDSNSVLPNAVADKHSRNRRSFLKATTAAVTMAAGVGMAGAATAASEYETITVGAGERRTFDVGSGETFENKLIDITADNADVRVVAQGTDWTLRNIGVRGSADVGNDQSGSPRESVGSSTSTRRSNRWRPPSHSPKRRNSSRTSPGRSTG